MSEEIIDIEGGEMLTIHDASANNFNIPSERDFVNSNLKEDTSKHDFPSAVLKEHNTISADHCYARPWNWRPETSFLRPTKTLFIDKLEEGIQKTSNPLVIVQKSDPFVDVELMSESPSVQYDVEKAKSLMDECLKYTSNARQERTDEEWEDKISKTNWTSTQNRLFVNMMNILNNFLLAKLSYVSSDNEPLLRHIATRKAVQRIRKLMVTIGWDQKLVQWLHQLLLDNVDSYYLACYLEILQALKSKLPTFVDKIIHGSSVRLGSLNSTNLSQLLDKSWHSIFTTLMQHDKPKKLPGNSVIVVVPSAPVVPKIMNKWIKLLSHLTTVVTVTTNFGQSLSSFNPKCATGHRMTLSNCVDHLFSVTRGKIQEVRAEYPGRSIILVGFNAGATLAIQVAQVEQVLCVISLGFSLLTAEGRRGEPEDNLLELQCPVLFVIGQRSNTSFQEDVEDLRERMRVENGLIVVGSADDYLRISKKKMKADGITQAFVDKCIIDEVGDFISGLILSPYPPQIKQPVNVPTESHSNKVKNERTRYNSNASSMDSEPLSPTHRITRPVGRPPGSKSKTRLETKWAQQIAQGNKKDPTFPKRSISPKRFTSPKRSTSPSLPFNVSPDKPINDISQNDSHSFTHPAKHTETPVKKLKTIKPVSPNKKAELIANTSPQQAKMQAYGINRSVNPSGNLSTLLQGGIKTIPPSQPKTSVPSIKVLENITLNTSATTKLVQGNSVDFPKITYFNSTKTGNTTIGNVILMPDGKVKTINRPVETGDGSQIILSTSTHKNPMAPAPRNKYITTKRQLLAQKPPKPLKMPISISNTTMQNTSQAPILTTQDIMDLPIIFADDNKILEPNTSSTVLETTTLQDSPSVSNSEIKVPLTGASPKVFQTITPGKFMLVNKQAANPNNYVITPTSIRKPNPLLCTKPPKYTKIILSAKKHNLEELKSPLKFPSLSPEVTLKRVSNHTNRDDSPKESLPIVELIDLENEIKATAVPKPNMNSDKNILLSSKTSRKDLLLNKTDVLIMKRPSVPDGDTDPDYIPPKTLKLQ